MTSLTENVWRIIGEQCEKYCKIDENFIFHKGKQREFQNLFNQKYSSFKEKYMKNNVKDLDRHKIAAIIILSLRDSNVIRYKDLDEEFIFIGDLLVALKTGLAYMLEELNEKLREKNIKHQITCFDLPNAQSCKTDYLSIMCRNLYFAKDEHEIVVLELAEKLFLLEYILLLKNNIDPDLLID